MSDYVVVLKVYSRAIVNRKGEERNPKGRHLSTDGRQT